MAKQIGTPSARAEGLRPAGGVQSGQLGAAAAVEVVNLVKSYGPVRALRGVSLAVARGEVHGVCGHNGAGKSTLVKVLVGLVHPDGGEVRVAGTPVSLHGTQDAQRHGIAIVDQELSLVPALTVAENIFLGNVDVPLVRTRRWEHRRARRLLDRVGLRHVSPGQLVERLSIGERQLVEIARLVGRNARLLILDEPTATLTDVEIERVFAVVRTLVGEGASVIFVSHRLGEVLSFCDRVSVVRDGALVRTRGTKDLSKDELVEMMLGEEGKEGPLIPPGQRLRDGCVQIQGLSVPGRVENFELDIPRGMIVGLAGQIGSGGSEILRAIAGLEPDAAGGVWMDERRVPLAAPGVAVKAGIQFVSNDRKTEGLFLDQSIENNLLATRLKEMSTLGVLRKRRMRQQAHALADLVGVDARRIAATVSTLSGGNQQKVFVGRCLEQPNLRLLLLNDPTRGVDVGGRTEIHRLIRHAAESGATILFASSELDEILELSDVVVALFAGQVVSRRKRGDATGANVLRDTTHQKDAPPTKPGPQSRE